jgi:hypothetical protein
MPAVVLCLAVAGIYFGMPDINSGTVEEYGNCSFELGTTPTDLLAAEAKQ